MKFQSNSIKKITKKELLSRLEESFNVILINSVIIAFILIFGFGVYANVLAISSNGGRMPIYTEYSRNTTEHFSFQDKESVQYFKYVDRFRMDWANNKIIYYSIGDVVLTLSFFAMLISAIYSIGKTRNLHKFRKRYLKRG